MIFIPRARKRPAPRTATSLVDEDGNEVDMSVVDIVEHKGENYVILLPVENIESGDMQFAVMKIEYDEDADEYTYVTGNDPEYDEVFVEFRERLEQELSIFDGIGDELESENELDHFDEDN